MSVIETMIDIPAEHERNVCGQFDTYLKKIERTLHVTMIARDGEIKIIGPEKTIGQAKSVFNNLIELSKRGNTITEQNVDYALSLSFTENDGQILEIDKDIICRKMCIRDSKGIAQMEHGWVRGLCCIGAMEWEVPCGRFTTICSRGFFVIEKRT